MALSVPDLATTTSDPDTARVAPYVKGKWAEAKTAEVGTGASVSRHLVVDRVFVVNPPAPKKDLLSQLSVVDLQMRQAAAEQGLDLDALLAGAAAHFTDGRLVDRPADVLSAEHLNAWAESDLAEFRE